MPLFCLRSLAMASVIAAGTASAPAEAQNAVLDTLQGASQATATAAQTTANASQAANQATANAAQATANAQQAALAAQTNPRAVAQTTAMAPAATPIVSAPIPPTKCSPAPTPQLFRACLEFTTHHNGSWQAQHPLAAQAKSGLFGAGVGGQPQSILAPSHTQN